MRSLLCLTLCLALAWRTVARTRATTAAEHPALGEPTQYRFRFKNDRQGFLGLQVVNFDLICRSVDGGYSSAGDFEGAEHNFLGS